MHTTLLGFDVVSDLSLRNSTSTQINKAKRDIQRRLTEIKTAKACALCTCIMSTDSMRQMYQAVRELTISRRGNDTVHVHDDDGNPLCYDEAKAEKIAEYFKKQFTDPVNPPLEPFQGDPRDLDVPITSDEVKKAVGKLKNGKSNGPDNIPNELIKAWHPDMNTAYAEVINQSFSTGVHIPSIGQGILTPLQKPGKPKGPVKSIRPLMLLNGARKILSLIAHDRICDKLDRYTGATQAAYKRGRSCADLIWTQRMLVSVVKNHHWEFSKIGISDDLQWQQLECTCSCY